MNTYYFTIDGYTVAERLLEQVMFSIELLQDKDGWRIGAIEPDPSARSYLERVKWEQYVPAIRTLAEENLAHTVRWCEETGSSLELEMDKFAAETGMAPAQLLAEI